MRLIKMLGLAALAAVAAMALVGATSASATSTQLCKVHTGLTCGAGDAVTSHHMVLASGTVAQLLAVIDVLCLSILLETTPLGLGSPQQIHTLAQTWVGCGTGSAHNNCTVSTPGQQPVFGLLKIGLDQAVLTGESGQVRAVCANLGLDCLHDIAGTEFEASGGHLTANETSTTELGGKFFCPEEGVVDALLEALTDVYALG